jgi:uncharacterized lipoprotein NlpE involved in copper resistance
MKKLIIPAIIVIFLTGCSSQAEKKESENLKIARKYMQAVESKNLTVIDSLLADNYKGYGPSVGDSLTRKEAIANAKYLMDNLYESFQYTNHTEIAVTVKEGKAKGDWVLNWAYLTIKFRDGRGPVHVWVNIAYLIDKGKIVFSRTFYNEADVLRQLGYTIEAPDYGI